MSPPTLGCAHGDEFGVKVRKKTAWKKKGRKSKAAPKKKKKKGNQGQKMPNQPPTKPPAKYTQENQLKNNIHERAVR